MKKILKIIRSRFFISAFIILLEFIQLLIVFSLLYKYSIVITILGYIFYVGVFIYIINKYESPEFKLPWIIIIMLFFVFGAFVFILASGNEENKKVSKVFKKNKEKIKPYLKQDDSLEQLKNENMDAYLQVNYITKSTELPCYKNTKVTYYKIGEDFHQELLKSLNEANHFIFMEYFIIEEGKMWNPIYDILKEKSKNGVKVYLIYDDFGCMSTLDEKYYQKISIDGINCIPSNKFKPVMSRIHNNRDHRKITVIDGIIGFTGGINLADEYINEIEKYGHWKDSAIKLVGESVKSLTALFLETWNTQSKIKLEPCEFMNLNNENTEKKSTLNIENDIKELNNQNIKQIEQKNIEKDFVAINEKGIIAPYGDGPVEFYKDNVGKYIYLNMLSSAKKYVYITTPYLICDYEILNAICLCAKKGIDIRIITPHIPDKKTIFLMTQSNYEILIQSGVKIYEYTPGFIHAKNFICDDIYATCGTVNLDYRSLVHHFECGVWMYNTKCIKDMKEDFLETIKLSQEITEKQSKLKGYKKLIAEIMKVFSPLL